jgi:hypothetical protein
MRNQTKFPMEQNQESILENFVAENVIERKKLIPKWILVFSWIFLVIGGIAILGFVASLFMANYKVALYGLESDNSTSPIGLLVTFLFVFKGIVAFGLLREKDWAVNAAIADAVIGILVCIGTMIALPFQFRLELALLIPYLLKMLKLRPIW